MEQEQNQTNSPTRKRKKLDPFTIGLMAVIVIIIFLLPATGIVPKSSPSIESAQPVVQADTVEQATENLVETITKEVEATAETDVILSSEAPPEVERLHAIADSDVAVLLAQLRTMRLLAENQRDELQDAQDILADTIKIIDELQRGMEYRLSKTNTP